MAVIQWSVQLSVGVPAIDSQHKQLINMINDLYDAMMGGKGSEALDKIIKDLVVYTKIHFRDEEAFMEKHGYPGLAQHKLVHEKLKTQVMDVLGKLQSGKMVASVSVGNFLKDWLKNHILSEDKKYSMHIVGQLC